MRWMIPALAMTLSLGCAHNEKYSAGGTFGGRPSAKTPKKAEALPANAGVAQAQPVPQPAQPALTEREDVAGRSCPVAEVYFPFNSAALDHLDKGILDESARCLKKDEALKVRIEGNADERGSSDYNYTLGEKRAEAARAYLGEKGVESSRVIIVSFGKDKPICTGHEESCWQRNRRAKINPGMGNEAAIPRTRQ